MFFLHYIWLIPLLPALGATLMFFFGRKLQKATVSAVCVGTIVLAFLMACGAVWQYSAWSSTPEHFHQPYQTILYTWLGTDTGHMTYVTHDGSQAPFQADAGFLLDPLSSIWLLFVTGVGMLIHIYSTGYMAHEGGYYRFFGYLNLFMFSMLTLILANNYALMFVGWEGVGLCSYLLIGFYFHRKSATDAGNKAFIVNRIGDAGFLLGMFFIAWYFGSLRFTEVTNLARSGHFAIGDPIITAATLLLFVGACGKSAQIPLYVWLPDAMEGPTPVSALIHAATMVTAGVYMVSRSHVIFERAPTALMVVAIIGTLTAFFAATIGITQTDIKKVLAYSTVSQLGYMFMACGVGAFSAGIFHLMTHAFFKGLLFLGAGSVIHAVGGEQDMRKMGGLKSYIPWTFLTMGIATLAIAGVPPLAGFWSKDEILWKAYQVSPVYWVIGVVTAFITSFYMFRLLYMTFFGDYRGAHGDGHAAHGHDAHGHGEPHESPMVMLVPLIILALLSLVGGLVGIGNHFEHFLAPVFGSAEAAEGASHSTELLLMGVSVAVALLGWWMAYLLYYKRPELPLKIANWLGTFYEAVVHKYYIDELYAAVFVKPLIDGSTRILWQDVDGRIIDASVNESADGARHVSDEVRHMQSGNIRSYAGWIAAGSAVVIAFMIWKWTEAQ